MTHDPFTQAHERALRQAFGRRVMSPAATPRPAEPCILGAALWFVMVVSAGTAIFVAGCAIANRLWPVKS